MEQQPLSVLALLALLASDAVMRQLPAIASGPGRWVLPMADCSARLLADLLLAENRAGVAGALADGLAADPPWLLWTVVSAVGRGGFQPSSVSDAAQWLADHATAVLQWPRELQCPSALADADAERFVDLASESLAAGHLAAHLASQASAAERESARLGGLLHNGRAWFARSVAHGAETLPEEFSRWLASQSGNTADSVARAAAILAGERLIPGMESQVAAARGYAQQAARGWAAAIAGLSASLPALAARLARLEQLERRFRETLEQEKLDAMAELAAGAGHEINNPLAIIAGRAQLFLKDETNPERRREAAIIVAQVKRAHEMIADLRLFARPPQLEPETIDMVSLVDAVLAELAPQAAERAGSIVRTGPTGPLSVEADPVQLSVAVYALVRNALEAIGHGGHVEVGLEADDAWAAIRVTDNGPGIAPEHRRHIFEPFFSARQAGRGLGMGLSKSWRIVTSHGGRIEVDGRPGGGTAFTIHLPRRLSS